MEENTKFQLKAGDWVKGKSKNGELLRGYIENVDSLQGTVNVAVVECDNEKTIGRTIETPIHWVDPLPVTTFNYEEQIRDLIDLALLTRDEGWFTELTAKLKSFQQGFDKSVKSVASYPTFRNRLGTSGRLK